MLREPFSFPVKKYLWIGLFIVIPVLGRGQENEIDSAAFQKQLDMKDVVHRLFHSSNHDQQRVQKKFQFTLFPIIGYTSNTGAAVSAGANGVFTARGASKESNMTTSFTYTQFNQTILPFSVSIWSKKDRFNFILDNRYINYPSPLYGLQGKSKLDSGYSVNFSWIKLHASLLARLTRNFYGGVGLFYDHFWEINEVGVPPVTPTTYNPLGIGTAFEHYTHSKIPPSRETAIGPALKLLFDSRDNPVNAAKGFYGAFLFHPVFKGWNSDTSWSSLMVDLRKYFSFSAKRESVLAFWGYYWQDFGKPSFLLLPSSGWDDFWNTGRGYSQGRYRGNSMRYLEGEYRFQVSRNGLVGGVIFTNLQNFPDELYTSYSESHGRDSDDVTALGYGFGLRMKFNKYSKTNVALDIGFGQDFPRPWFAVNLGEVF
jgi:hypothetical protein